ncbi:protein kinase [Shewanella sp. Choline-02u-19]|uniref:leucine-rich repeat-containing protein kinase family protein n=1 Tax=unclassified Shewanella TaxID=196818 RepID=UPI000C334D2C|nr:MULTISPECIES: leucine-rich repeat-containing protein kinase family protein [unclassified Shewanella]PKG73896.1 protein kinase [Shewanella sp. GutCb]PKH54890.1 protein kinase [Shewanella sp. Bg11-22]PKI26662.1 protein kinase [Shewanella sp. Choline-02u-19]
MQTLAQLTSGELKGIKRLTLSENLTVFPEAIFSLADTLEVLDLSDNQLTELPNDFARLQQLKRLFLTNNKFEQIPTVIAACPRLEMISFKSNKLRAVAQGALPLQTRWLILTDNQITSLPDDMGSLHQLQKLALAGNKLSALPASMANCSHLALARISANHFTQFPDWLFQLPKLAWLALSGNPLTKEGEGAPISAKLQSQPMQTVALTDIQLGQVIGQGASGVIYSAKWLKQPESLYGCDLNIAVKLFKGEVTSDGYPSDELACCLQSGTHHNLIKVVAQINQADQLGLVMELIPSSFANLGLPPSLDTCTRDTFVNGEELGLQQVLLVLTQMADTMTHLHQNGVSHGDVYAHNTMINLEGSMLFGDFGASSNLNLLPELQKEAMESIEIRALGCLIDDLVENRLQPRAEQLDLVAGLKQMSEDCLQMDLALRPRFSDMLASLNALQNKLTAAMVS